MVERYGEDAYTSGMKVYTTVNSRLQDSATTAAVNNLIQYDERHGYRGAERELWKQGEAAWSAEEIAKALDDQPIYGDMYPAIVTNVDDDKAVVYVKNQGVKFIAWDGMKWARRFITDTRQGDAPKQPSDVLVAGQQIWTRNLTPNGETEAWHLSQVPNANTAFVALNPENGALLSLVGGFNFVHSKFNRATQSIRQVGSGIKPFIYSAAMNQGLTLATLINDAPINRWDKSQGTAWRPENSPPRYGGPTRMRIGLAQSKNVMAVRVLREVGINNAREYLARFGFDIDHLPKSETLALGAGSLTPLKLAQGYSVFVNGGYYVEPYYIDHVLSPYGELEYQASPSVICQQNCDKPVETAVEDTTSDTQEHLLSTASEGDDNQVVPHYAPQVITEQNAFLVREMLYSNIWGGKGWAGTGWRGQWLHRRDVGGKTGTTNDSKDTWYNGFGPGVVASVWVGFDDHTRKLGRTYVNRNLPRDEQTVGGESGGKTAQPAWIEFMKTALQDVPQAKKTVPSGITRVRIDRATGLLTDKFDDSSMFEYFIDGTEPKKSVQNSPTSTIYSNSEGEELF
jgi:penicillin-binding protein 1A